MTNAASPNEPMQSVHTSNFPALLNQLGISLVISTYQAGKVIILRADNEHINTHFRMFQKPMGIAANQHKIAIGCNNQIWELNNVPVVASKIEPQGKHDACYLPRKAHVTGDIDIHEMEWGRNNIDLWFVNTRFSCLCTLDVNYSFVPRWRPKFITALTPEDRCHLNGLAMVDGQPRYVTALGQTDTQGGWRENKTNGGILIDVADNAIINKELSMPHSPRWYQDRLWVLESGKGTLSICDTKTSLTQTVAILPGFTRGIDFYGSLAFIGLSQVRETAVFSGIPLPEKLAERICGVWVVSIETGQTVAFLKFEDAVQEIFAVKILPNIRFPELIDWDQDLIGNSYVLPNYALADVPPARLSI